MLRIFTKDVGKLHKKGHQRDYPKDVWSQIERSQKAPLNSFSKVFSLEENKK